MVLCDVKSWSPLRSVISISPTVRSAFGQNMPRMAASAWWAMATSPAGSLAPTCREDESSPPSGDHFSLGWPHFRGVGELGSSSVIRLFRDHWAEIAQGRMATLPMIEDLNVLKARQLRPPFESERGASLSTHL